MLNKLDDFPIHQTPEPIAHPWTSDRNVYDRFWFNGFSADGSYYFGIAMGLYPLRGVMDCAFSIVRPGGLQRSFFGSRRAPLERTDMTVGPFRISIDDPMRQCRVTLDDNASGLGCDLTFSTRTAAIEEMRQTLWLGARRVADATRFDQFGRWSGQIMTPDGDIRVDETACYGTKDRSWGVRRVGEQETGGAPSTPQGVFFLWAPLIWDDHVTHAIFIEGSEGQAIIREGLVAPLYRTLAEVPDGDDAGLSRMATARHRVTYVPGTRLARVAEIDLIALDGKTRTIRLEPKLKFQMKGIGYNHPEWSHGMWKGEVATGHDTFDPAKLDMLEPSNLHVQQLMHVSDDTRRGIGTLEQLCYGPHAPSGFNTWLDGAMPE